MNDLKKTIRDEILKTRGQMSPDEVLDKSNSIKMKITELDEYKKSKMIMCYVDFKNEVMTGALIEYSLKQGKRVCVPVVINEKGKRDMLASELFDMEKDLETGSFGIREPKKTCIRPVNPEDIDLVIVPGLAFDLNKNRIGFGGGFYDRFLPKVRKDAFKVAVAYDFQIREKLPVEYYDMPVDMIVTESRIIL